ncbi:MAG: DUF937 domain-containing protein, partial [Candidatus Binatia bacterium]
MANLYQVLAEAQNGEVMSEFGQQFGLSPQQTRAAVDALLPAISMGLKRATATPEGLGHLLAVMGAQPDFYEMYDDTRIAFSREGRTAGNAALSSMFGSPEVSRAIADHAQQMSGISSTILKKLLPVLAGIIISSLMKSGPGKAAPSAPPPQPTPDVGGGLGDILRQIFRQGSPESTGPGASPAPQTVPKQDGGLPDLGPRPGYQIPTGDQKSPVPTDSGGQVGPGGDILAQIMRELAKAIEEGRLKPVVVGPVTIGIPEQTGPTGQTQSPMGDVFGQILRDLLSGKGGQLKPATLAGGIGSAVFGDRLEAGQGVDPAHLRSLQEVL